MKSSKVNGFLVIAFVITALLLACTVFLGVDLYKEKMASFEPHIFSSKSLTELPGDGFPVKVTKPSQEEKIIPNLYYTYAICKKAGIETRYISFYASIELDSNDIKVDKLLALGIGGGTHSGGMIFVTTDNIAIASPKGLFIEKPDEWEMVDFKNLYFYFEKWSAGEGKITGNTVNLETLTASDNQINWRIFDRDYTLSKSGLTVIDDYSLAKSITRSSFIPTLPPILYLGLITLLLILAGIFLWKMGNYDLAIACFFVVPALFAIGGFSVLLRGILPEHIIPLSSFLGTCAAFSVPIILLWAGLSLDKTLGYFWLITGIITGITTLDFLYPYSWIIAVGVAFILVVVLAICVPTRNRDVRL